MSEETKDKYKDTVFLPKTDFPMRGGLPQKEPEILKGWQEMGLYAKMRARSAGKKNGKWILHDGPPYANGNIHMGHALNKILKDVVVKYTSMLGYDTPYVPGWDCHGLPIEWKIEEQYREAGKDKDDVDILKFRDECRKFAQGWVDVQAAQFQRLGVSGDFDNPYLTMHLKAEADIVREIHKFAMNGGLYQGAKPVMWSVVEQTALAEAEVEYKEHKSITVWVRFPVVKAGHELLEGADIVIWTTTPWTLPSNRALAYGADVKYSVVTVISVHEGSRVQVGDKLAVAETLLPDIIERAQIMEVELEGNIKGSELAGTICAHPLRGQGYEFDVPMLEGEFVTDDAGTGFVHIAPGHGEDDFYLGVANGVEVTDNITDDGKFREHVPLFAGLEVYTQKGEMGAGNFAPIKAIEEAGKLLAKGSLRHEYPHSWRSKAPVIFRTTKQWFIGMEQNELRTKSLAAIKETKWIPAKGETRITSMIAGRPDWCISRQRAWGVPIALFVHKDTGEILRDADVFARIGEAFEAEGSDAWWAKDAQAFLGDKYSAEEYEQVFDIVDVWFESGSTHAFVCEDRDELQSPADLYLEGSDQHRGWFHSSLLESCGTRGRAPYKTVLTHGFVLDEKGYKMSKSLGNVVDPLKMMETYGADILRLWVMMSNFEEDIRIGQDMLKTTSDLYRRIRNTLRFLLGALDGYTKDEAILSCHPETLCVEGSQGGKKDPSGQALQDDISELPELERLMLHRLYEVDQKVRSHIENYEFSKLAKLLHDFCNEDLSSFYFDIRKDRLYCDAPDSLERRACRTVMAEIFKALSAWLAPILCYTAEEAWSHKPDGVFEDVESVHLREFPDVPESWKNEALAQKWGEAMTVRKAVLEAIEPLRASKELGSSLEAKPVITVQNAAGLDWAEICITAPAEIKEGELSVEIQKAEGGKCARCWKVLPEVTAEQDVCNRCEDAVASSKSKAA